MNHICNYFVRRSDLAVFAIEIVAGKSTRAAGPLTPAQQQGSRPMEHFGRQTIDASDWDLAAFMESGKRWECIAAPPPLPKRVDERERDRFRVGHF